MSEEPAPAENYAALFEYAGEMLDMARIHSQLGTTYASIGDLAGLEYSTRRVIAYLKSAIPSVKELREVRLAAAVHAEFGNTSDEART